MAQVIVWAEVGADGDLLSGTGCSVTKTSEGTYQIDFTDNFSDTPAIVGSQVNRKSPSEVTTDNVVFPLVTHAQATALTGDKNGDLSNRSFSFIAVGETV